MNNSKLSIWSLLCLVGVAVVLIAITLFSLSAAIQAACIVGLTIVLWASGALPQWFTALLFFVLCAIADIVEPQVFLSGMFSPAMWLLVAGSVIGLAIKHTGLGERLASFIVPLMTSYRRALLGSASLGLIFVFLVPSAMGRIAVLLPILLPLSEQLGYKDNTRARNGIVLAAVLSTFLPAFTVLPANVPNNILLGMVKMLFAETPTYAGYLWLHFPVLGLLKTALIVMVLMVFYRADSPRPVKQNLPKLSCQEKRLLAVLMLTLFLWISEPWHGVDTAWVAMIGAMLCLLPGLQLTPKKPLQALNNETFFYIAAIVGLGVVVYHSGLATLIADASLRLLPLSPHHQATNFSVLSLLATLLSMLVALPGVPAILTPMTADFANLSGWPSYAVYMTQVIGFSTVLFPYQAPPLVLAMQMGKIPLRDMLSVLLPLTLLTVAILWPLDYLWWSLVGVLP
ncbi:MAG: sodium:sulfate symporter [Gammaproteobacteria bacterium]|nr:MAG: sodium:sulfate symporter [Gammaproteobacteria bacterium]